MANLNLQTSNIHLRSMPYTRNKFRNLACEEDCPKDLEFDGFFKEKIQTLLQKTHHPQWAGAKAQGPLEESE